MMEGLILGRNGIVFLCAAVLTACNTQTQDPIADQQLATPKEVNSPQKNAQKLPALKKTAVREITEIRYNMASDRLNAYILNELGDDITMKIKSVHAVDNWIFACGDLMPPDSSPAQTFCALLSESGSEVQLLEFEITGYDASYHDWFKDHGVPKIILGE